MTVTQEWMALMQLLQEVAPKAVRSFLPPAPAGALQKVEASTGLTWTDELREFYSLHGGQIEVGNTASQILPAQDVFGVEQMASERAMMIEVWQAITDADPEYFVGGYAGVIADNPEAGTHARAFLPQYIPLSGADGNLYFCDLRPGGHHGCVRAYDRDSADEGGPLWWSIAEMIAGIRQSIVDGTAIDGWEPRRNSGEIYWLPEGADDELEVAGVPPEPRVVHTGYDEPHISLSGQHDEPGADRDAIARAVLAAAADKYGAHRVSGGHPIIQWVPNAPGFTAGCMVGLDGENIFYAATITDTDGEFIITEVPPQGLRMER